VRDKPVKDAAQKVAEDVTQDVAEDLSGAAEDGSVKVFVVARVIFHRPPRFPWATREGRARQGRGGHAAQNAAEGVKEGVLQDVVQELAFGARAPRAFLASPLATTTAAAVFLQLTLR